MKENLHCPVKRLQKTKVEIEVSNHKNDMLNIKADIDVKNPMISFIKFLTSQIAKKD